MIETFYDEVVAVRNGIALCNMEHVRDALLDPNVGYEYIGEIKHERQLNALLNRKKAEEQEEVYGLDIRKHVLKIEDILPVEEPTVPEIHKPWIDTLE
jgi:hypothetical protein